MCDIPRFPKNPIRKPQNIFEKLRSELSCLLVDHIISRSAYNGLISFLYKCEQEVVGEPEKEEKEKTPDPEEENIPLPEIEIPEFNWEEIEDVIKDVEFEKEQEIAVLLTRLGKQLEIVTKALRLQSKNKYGN